jgi:hydroxymethylglutaryl-CoA reductase
MQQPISGFSKRNKAEKIKWIVEQHFEDPKAAAALLTSYSHPDASVQEKHDEFIENTLSNFYLPVGVAPNFLINGRYYTLPMVIEESSVVAAAGKAAKYWADRGGFRTTILGMEKVGQIHFLCSEKSDIVQAFFESAKKTLIRSCAPLLERMEKRGGGLLDLQLIDKTAALADYYQLHATFDTQDAMGANFINSVLEQLAEQLLIASRDYPDFAAQEQPVEVVMSILSNYVPNCLVRAEARCPVTELEAEDNLTPEAFAQKVIQAVQIAQVEPYRAVTHNKGIMNGIDAVVLATGNDFRAIEAGIHAYAARDGHYRSLTKAFIENETFVFQMDLPLAVGTVGGLTQLHPMVKWSLELLQNPSARELMQIIAVAGLAQNFAAIRSLVTSGIQQGHMKMHLLNILNQLDASAEQKEQAIEFFKTNAVSHSAVQAFLTSKA